MIAWIIIAAIVVILLLIFIGIYNGLCCFPEQVSALFQGFSSSCLWQLC